MSNTSNPKIIKKTVGRRKRSVASVYLTAGTGQITVNAKPVENYFPGEFAKRIYSLPFVVTDLFKYDASVKVHGGGKEGQLDALVLGIARSLSEIKDTYKSLLRKAGLMTRDSRERQRRMIGTGGKSRRQKSSPKR